MRCACRVPGAPWGGRGGGPRQEAGGRKAIGHLPSWGAWRALASIVGQGGRAADRHGPGLHAEQIITAPGRHTARPLSEQCSRRGRALRVRANMQWTPLILSARFRASSLCQAISEQMHSIPARFSSSAVDSSPFSEQAQYNAACCWRDAGTLLRNFRIVKLVEDPSNYMVL